MKRSASLGVVIEPIDSNHRGIRRKEALFRFCSKPYATAMVRGESDVVALALGVLKDAAERGRREKIEKSVLIALALACLITRQSKGQPPVRWPFVQFWQHLDGDNDIGRSQNLQAALNAIRIAVQR